MAAPPLAVAAEEAAAVAEVTEKAARQLWRKGSKVITRQQDRFQ